MPSSEIRYQRGDVYRSYDEDILRARRSSSSTSSVLSGHQRHGAKRHFGSATSAENAAIQRQVNRQPYQQRSSNEYLTKKKVEVKTTKNTEKRVQRCIVLEDGRIIEHDDPHIVVDTIEDTQTHEFDHLDDPALAKELQASIKRSYQKAGISYDSSSRNEDSSCHGGRRHQRRHQQRRKSLAYDDANHVSGNKKRDDMISGDLVTPDITEDGSIVNDTFKRVVNTHDVKENVVRTHAAKDLGMISRRGLRKVLNKQGKVSDYIKYDDDHHQRGKSKSNGRRQDLVRKYETESHKRIVDTEDTHEISRRLKNGQVRSETFRTETHEVFDNKKAPDDAGASGSSETEVEKDEQRFKMTKTRDFTDYYDAKGNLLMKGPELVSRDVNVVGPKTLPDHFQCWAPVGEERIRQTRHSMKKKLRPSEDAERKDALTKQPLDLNKEERTRKKETDKWLERHFGSDWSLAGSSRIKYLHGDKSSQMDANAVRRTMSFSSIPIHYTNPGEKVSRVIKQTTTTIRPGFDKHVVSSITKSMVPNNDNSDSSSTHHRRHKSLDAKRPYHSTLTLATDGRPLESKRCHASTTSLLNNETSKLTFRQVPIERQESPQPRPRTRVQRLIDEQRSHHSSSNRSTARSAHNRRSYYYGEDPRVQSEPPRRVKEQSKTRVSGWNAETTNSTNTAKRNNLPLYRTELLKTSDRMYQDETESMINRRHWRDELSKSYHDISWQQQHHSSSTSNMRGMPSYKKEMAQSYSELPRPSQLFGWTDEFHLHNYGHYRDSERAEGIRHHHHGTKNGGVQRSKSFAHTGTPSDGHSSVSEESYHLLKGHQHRSKSYKDTKVSSPPPPEPFAGFASDIQQKYDEAKASLHTKKTISSSSKKTKSNTKKTRQDKVDAVYEFEQKIPMQSSILEAQKFKTVIFVSGT